MNTKLKKEIEKEFNKQMNFDTIISKIENKKRINIVKIKYILAPTCAVLIGIIGFIGVKKHLQEQHILIDNINIEQEIQDEDGNLIKINKYISSIESDIDGKWVDTNLLRKYSFCSNIYIPEYLNKIRQGEIYVRDGIEDENYSKFIQNTISFYDDSEPEGKHVTIDFSKQELLPDCYASEINLAEVSIIDDIKLKIFVGKIISDSSKIRGKAYLEHNDYKFEIDVYKITQDEFMQVIKTLTAEVKEHSSITEN